MFCLHKKGFISTKIYLSPSKYLFTYAKPIYVVYVLKEQRNLCNNDFKWKVVILFIFTVYINFMLHFNVQKS